MERITQPWDDFDPRNYMDNRLAKHAPAWYDDVNWSSFHDEPLQGDEKFVTEYMMDVEGNTGAYRVIPILNGRNLGSVSRSMKAAMWEFEEGFHFLGLYAALKAGDPTLPEPDVLRAQAFQTKRAPALKAALSGLAFNNLLPARVASGVANTTGVINEHTTSVGGYRGIEAMTAHQGLKVLAASIAPEEGQHMGVYKKLAKEDLGDGVTDGQLKLARRVLEHTWSLVGEGFQPTERSHEVVRILAQAPNFGQTVVKIDENASTIPGMEGLEVMQRYVEKALAA